MTTIIKIEVTADDDTHAADVLTRLAIKLACLIDASWKDVGGAEVATSHGEGRAVVTRANRK